MPDWKEQWDRVTRYYTRFEDMNSGIDPHGTPADYFFDDMWAFFQNCYHLKDWLKHSGFTGKGSDPESFINGCDDLKICADLCNGLKHLVRTGNIRSGNQPQRSEVLVSLTGGSPIATFKATIDHNGKFIDAFELATNCFNDWKGYVS